MLKHLGVISLVATAVSLSACTYLRQDNHQVMCQQLKNQILMNGATSNQQERQQQQQDLAQLNKSYENEGCN